MSRNIGGSYLPSGGSFVGQRVPFMGDLLEVRACPDLDTHFLLIHHKDGTSLLAQHANGHSCKALADRMIAGDAGRVEEQRVYIEDCGGMVRSRRAFEYHMKAR